MSDQSIDINKKILIMDDEKIIHAVLKKLFTKLGYQTEFTTCGEETIEIYQNAITSQSPFSAVILDLTVPVGMGGRETILELKKIDQNVFGIISSGLLYDPVMENYRDYGFSAVIPKPYDIEDIKEVLKGIDI